MIALLLACGIDGGRDQPNPPPAPPGRFEAPEDGTRHLEGTLSDTTLATRSFSFVAGGKRFVGVLTPSANVLVDGRVAGLDAVPLGAVVAVEAQVHDDVLMVQRLKFGAEPEKAPEAAPEPTSAPADAAAPADAQPPAPGSPAGGATPPPAAPAEAAAPPG